MILDIDVGNSYVKWVIHDGDIRKSAKRGRVAANDVAGWLGAFRRPGVERVRMGAVQGATAAMIERWAAELGLPLRQASVVDGTGGVYCGYREHARLGIDRWLAMLAARSDLTGRSMVVDAGTALTVDLLDGDGVHAGGYIAPGLTLMMGSLGRETWGVRVTEALEAGLAPGCDTNEAVSHGCLAAVVGMVAGIAGGWSPDTIVVTGGDGPAMARHLAGWLKNNDTRIRIDDDLVLAGLAIALP